MSSVNEGDRHNGQTKWAKRVYEAKYGGTLGFGSVSIFAKKAEKTLEKPKVTKAAGVSGVVK
jgi:hypothetical protein